MRDKQTRQVKVYGKYREVASDQHHQYRKVKEVPWLNVSGVWLEKAGFPVGSQVQITIDNDMLIIQKMPADGVIKH